MDFLSLWRNFRHFRARRCVLCHDSDDISECGAALRGSLCAGCSDDLEACLTDAANSCPLCFRPNAGGAMCGRCQKKPPAYERMWASVYYEPPVSTMIHEWKHLADLSLGGVLAGLMLRHAPDWLAAERIDYLLPVPLSKERRLFRGFNQSEGLVEHLAQHYGWRILPRDSVLRADKPPQSTLKSSERLRNVRHVFSLAQPLPPQCNILLVDDVMTTGATLAELSETLKKSGAQNVFCWTLARAQMKN